MPPQTRKQAKPTEVTYTITVDGRTYNVTLAHLPASIAMRVRTETQRSLAWWIDQLGDGGDPDIDAVAVFVWAAQLAEHRAADGPAPKLADVLESINYGSQLELPDPDAVAAEAGKAPADGTPT